MDVSLGYGELLVSLPAIDWSLSTIGGLWTGAGNPVVLNIPIPDEPLFVGVPVFCQGAILDTTTNPTLWIGLTRAAEIRVGY